MGTEIGGLGGYGFRDTVTSADGSKQKGGKMGAGYVNLRKQRKRQQRKVGREEEGSSSNHPEPAAFILALRGTSVTNPMLYLCDNQVLLKAVKIWLVETYSHIKKEWQQHLRLPTTPSGGTCMTACTRHKSQKAS